jgi:hypothetical protein
MKNKLLLLTITIMLFKANGFASILTHDTVFYCWAKGLLSDLSLTKFQTNNDNAKNTWRAIDKRSVDNMVSNTVIKTTTTGFFRYELTFTDAPGGGLPVSVKDTLTIKIQSDWWTNASISVGGSTAICPSDSVLLYFADSAKLYRSYPVVWSNGKKGFHIYAKPGTYLTTDQVSSWSCLKFDPITIEAELSNIQALSVDGSSQICEGDSAKVFFADSALLTQPLIWSNGTKGFHTYIKESSFVKAEIQMQDANTCFAFDSVLVQTGDCTSSIVDGIILNEDSSIVCLPSASIDLRDFQMDTSDIKNYWTSLDGPTLKDDHIFEPTAEGIYRFELYFAETILGQPNLFFDTLYIEVKKNCTTSINDQQELKEVFAVFPNPSSGWITLSKKNMDVAHQIILVKDT